MQDNQLTFEEVNKHIESVDLSQFEKDGKYFFTSEAVAKAPADALQKICAIYKVIKPILGWVLLILPQKWKALLQTFMDTLDKLCP